MALPLRPNSLRISGRCLGKLETPSTEVQRDPALSGRGIFQTPPSILDCLYCDIIRLPPTFYNKGISKRGPRHWLGATRSRNMPQRPAECSHPEARTVCELIDPKRKWPVMRKECASCLLCAPTVRGVTGNARLAVEVLERCVTRLVSRLSHHLQLHGNCGSSCRGACDYQTDQFGFAY